MVEVDKNVPIPERRYWGRTIKYPFRELDVGDSFFVAMSDKLSISGLQTGCSKAGSRLNRKFTMRKVDGGYRVWRIA